MRSLTIGIILFLIWSATSTWYYVCHVRDLCGEPDLTNQAPPKVEEPVVDTVPEVVTEVIPLPDDLVIQFGYNSDKVNAGPDLNTFLDQCKKYFEQTPEAMVLITGHTCSIGTSMYNMELGKRRAESTAAWLNANGVPTANIQTSSKGEDAPIADNATESGRVKNRRSELTVKN